ncbi:MAG: hypothetical protein K9L74_03195 [Candidatus Izimaplasma sp.]|nr:hypothetical protein [Candidatus Izimaplasma bacterium]
MKMAIKIIGLILLLIIVGITTVILINPTYRKYQSLINTNMSKETSNINDTITEDDLQPLPLLIQDYLRYVGVLGTAKVSNFQLSLEGEMKMKRDADFSPYKAQQTSFINQGTRLFYMDLFLNKIKISGLHHFHDADATMKIKILDLLTVVNEGGEKMQKAETVTFFNDMVVFAPQTLINNNISWEVLDNHSVEATFTHNNITISAQLFFDDEGKLINFVSHDRLALTDDGGQTEIPWSTPISEYHTINGLNLPKYGEGVWHYDDGDFTYIILNVVDIKYNITSK